MSWDVMFCHVFHAGPSCAAVVPGIMAPVPARQAGEVIDDDGSGHERIVAYLEELKVL